MSLHRCRALCAGLLFALFALPAAATGEIGEHVNDLDAHLATYSEEVQMLVDNVDGMVSSYVSGGQSAVDTDDLIDWWESVDYHEAVEVNHVPVYAAIWQGIYGVKEAIEQGKPIAEVRAAQQQLASIWWQGLGVVKMAAQVQSGGSHTQTASTEPASAADTMSEIMGNLARIATLHSDGNREQALALVHTTYGSLFEGLEGDLIEQDADLVLALEKNFNVTLPKALEGNPADVDEVLTAMTDKLERADELLEKARENRKDVF